MSDLDQALTDIQSIRRQVAAATEFRGYGPATLFGTSCLAVLTGAVQALWLPRPALHPTQYVALWLSTAVLSATLIATEMLTRATRLHSGLANAMVLTAVTSFLPAGIAGAILPFFLLHVSAAALWMLPGLWQIIFSLGVFASCRSLPRSMLSVGVWFMLCGFACLALGDIRALHPFTMTLSFAPGIALVAVIHRRSAQKVVPDEVQSL